MQAVSGVTSSGNPIVLPSVADQRLVKKVADTSLTVPANATVGWSTARVFTPGGMCGYRNEKGVELFSFNGDGSVKLFRSGKRSQGLILQDDQVVGASVTSKIHTKTKRKDEKKGTFVQYDKTRVEQDGKDFTVDATNYRGWVNYQGGHLIDHKYSAGKSHTHEKNYIPDHYFYNAPLKEYLVQRCEAYVEIPLYTPNPPTIGVKGDPDDDHEIPVGIIFVQINDNQIDGAYYFPNNDFDYRGFQKSFRIKTKLAENMVPYFKLQKCFHQLLWPALIFDFDAVTDGKSKQVKREKHFFKMIDDVSFGMSLAECSEDQETITRLAFSVLHQEAVDPFLCLECDAEAFDEDETRIIAPAFNALGEFLVRYGLRNALKSEVISIKSRLVFVNVLIDFIEAESQVSGDALRFANSLAPEFKAALKELDKIMDTMNLEELVYLANSYQRLCSKFNHPFTMYGYAIFDSGDLDRYLTRCVTVLKVITSKHSVESFDEDLGWTFLDCVEGAQDTLEYLLETGYDEEMFEDEAAYLESISPYCLKLLERQPNEDGVVTAQFQTNVGRGMGLKTSMGYLESVFANLGVSDEENNDKHGG